MSKVSVLIPTYNRADYLVEAIASVQSQTYPSWELIIVDDGSTDNTREVIEQCSAPIHYAYQPNRGVSAARNRAFSMSSGQYIVLLDSDDVLLPQALEKLSDVLDKQSEVDLVHGDGWVCNNDGEITGRWSEYWQTPFDSPLENVVVCNSLPIVRAAMIRRGILERVSGPFDEKMIGYEDWDLVIRLVAVGCRVTNINEPVCKYRIHAGSKSLPTSKWAMERQQSLIRSRLKVLAASWFDTMSLQARQEFFYDLFTNVLNGEYDLQEEVLAHDSFATLPVEQQGRLLYHLAVENLSDSVDFRREFRRIAKAIRLRPFDSRLYVTLGLSLFGTRVLRLAIAVRRRLQNRTRNTQDDPVTEALTRGHMV